MHRAYRIIINDSRCHTTRNFPKTSHSHSITHYPGAKAIKQRYKPEHPNSRDLVGILAFSLQKLNFHCFFSTPQCPHASACVGTPVCAADCFSRFYCVTMYLERARSGAHRETRRIMIGEPKGCGDTLK